MATQRRGNGDGSIFQQGNRWVACVTVQSGGGRQVRRKRIARTRTEARTLLRQLQKETAAGVLGSGQATLATLPRGLARSRSPSPERHAGHA